MMAKRWLIGMVAVVAVVAVGGIGFSAFTTSAFVNGNAAAGTFGPLYWTHPADEDSPGEICYSHIGTMFNTSDTLNVYAQNLAPGGRCSFYSVLNNGGSIPANVYATLTSTSGTGCGDFWYVDSFASGGYSTGSPGPYGPMWVGAYGSQNYWGQIGMEPGGNSGQGAWCDFQITLTASVGSS